MNQNNCDLLEKIDTSIIIHAIGKGLIFFKILVLVLCFVVVV